jgi:alkanesulfonate monooxygenase SsuD/methylene tetrahydromethanopterin reductase-like flavin-dependent oxidoreductase (luciferase family)
MRVGLFMDLRNPPAWERPRETLYEQTLQQCAEAERLGIDSVWLTEHHGFDDGYLPQPLTLAAAIAARTACLRIGTAVLIAPLRPAIDIAEQAALVDLISGGRVELGLGAGYRAEEFAAFGADIGRRYALLEERAAEVQRLWEDGGVTPAPLQPRAPLWIGAHGPRGARIAGRLGAGMLSFGSRIQEPYRRALAEAGHPAGAARLTSCANLIVSEDPEAAWPRIAPHLAYQWSSYARYGLDLPGLVAGAVDPEALRHPGPNMAQPRFDVVTPAEAVRRIAAWLNDLPVETVYFWRSIAGMPDDLAEEHVRLLATEVGPALARLG